MGVKRGGFSKDMELHWEVMFLKDVRLDPPSLAEERYRVGRELLVVQNQLLQGYLGCLCQSSFSSGFDFLDATL